MRVSTGAKIVAIDNGLSLRGQQLPTFSQMFEDEKMAAIGRRVSFLSHDIKHSLSAIRANVEFLECPNLGSCDRTELLMQVQHAVLEITDLIDSLLRYASTGQNKPRVREKISTLVESAVAAVKSHPDAYDVDIQVGPLPTAEADMDVRSIESAIYNLLLNACQAANRSACAPKANVFVSAGDELIYITITDNGPGVPSAISKTLFDPFVTAGKPDGTGLGLTQARCAAEEHGGCISLEESGSSGTIFTFSLERDRTNYRD